MITSSITAPTTAITRHRAVRKPKARQPENKSAQDRTNNSYNQVSQKTHPAPLYKLTRKPTGEDAEQYRPD